MAPRHRATRPPAAGPRRRGSRGRGPRRSAAILPAAIAIALAAPAAPAQEPVADPASPWLSPRNASYDIQVRLDPAGRSLQGTQRVIWRNLQPIPAEELRFHLYWNAWRNDQSTWMREDRIRERSDHGDRVKDDDWSWIEVDALRLLDPVADAATDLTAAMRFDAPDDGNPEDRTVLVVPLPRPAAPGETVQVEMEWRARIPRTFARTGFRGAFFFLAHWFPALGVFEASGWNCHQFHAATEFFSDYGTYDVRMTVPAGWTVGATGRETERGENPDGTVTHRYRQEDVHTFTWTTSPLYVERLDRFEEAGLPAVEIRLLMQPEHWKQAERHLAATKAALGHYGAWFGPYPYGHVTVIDPAYEAGAGGMEYPTLFTCGTRLFAPPGADRPESVTVHEAGHQFWYGLVGNDEFTHAWIDEGLNTYSQLRVMEEVYGYRTLEARFLPPPGDPDGGFFPWLFRDIPQDRWADRLRRYRRSAASDAPETPTWQYYPATAGDITYSKTALWLRTLERHLGWDTVRRILSTFFLRHRFGHPGPEDFLAVAEEVSGQDLGWFFDQVYRDAVRFDYAVASAESVPTTVRGFVNGEPDPVLAPPVEDDEAGPFRTEVVVQRREEGIFPVEILLVFEDGEEIRERWDGAARWRRIVVDRPSRLRHAVVDPDRTLMLDIHPANNSRRREPASRLPAAKWASKWMIWLQDYLAAMAFFL